jgi:hypothetical protein
MKKACNPFRLQASSFGGEGGIRTHGRVAPTLDFESSTFDHSATSPEFASVETKQRF